MIEGTAVLAEDTTIERDDIEVRIIGNPSSKLIDSRI